MGRRRGLECRIRKREPDKILRSASLEEFLWEISLLVAKREQRSKYAGFQQESREFGGDNGKAEWRHPFSKESRANRGRARRGDSLTGGWSACTLTKAQARRNLTACKGSTTAQETSRTGWKEPTFTANCRLRAQANET